MDQAARSEGQQLLARVRERIRFKHYSLRTEQAYVDWIRRYIRFNGNRHPVASVPRTSSVFSRTSPSISTWWRPTQNQAQSSLLFLYREILAVDLAWLDGVVRRKTSRRLPVVLTPDETAKLIGRLRGTHRLFAALLYGTGMRVMEGARMRVKDVDSARGEIIIRDRKGAKDCITMLPRALAPALRRHLVAVRALHQADVAEEYDSVWLPPALRRNYPSAPSRVGMAVRVSRRPPPPMRGDPSPVFVGAQTAKSNQSQLSAPPV